MARAKLYKLQPLNQLSSTPTTWSGAVYNQSESDSKESSLLEDNTSTPFIIRILVTSMCCGMIIWRGGPNIKSMKEKSEVSYLQLSPNEHKIIIGGSTMSMSERIMTITGLDLTSCANCVRIIVNDTAQNPEISRYINMTTCYSKNLPTISSSYVASIPSTSGFFLDHPITKL